MRAGNYLGVICLLFGAACAAFIPGSLEQRIGNLFSVGLVPAVGFYVGGYVVGQLLVFGVTLCDMVMARCSRYAVHLVNGLLNWAGTHVSNWLNGGARNELNVRGSNGGDFGPEVRRHGRRPWSPITVGLSLTALAFGWLSTSPSYWPPDSQREEPTAAVAIHAVGEQIIRVESGGDPNAKNKRSSAIGLGQFLDETWLDMIRAHRPDLAKGRSQAEVLELRRDAKIAREITARFIEQNAEMLRERGLPVTPGTLYLAHFAGGAGAVAILSAMETTDAALVMATADATGLTKREKIIKANPFLERFNVADFRNWGGPENAGFRFIASPRMFVTSDKLM